MSSTFNKLGLLVNVPLSEKTLTIFLSFCFSEPTPPYTQKNTY